MPKRMYAKFDKQAFEHYFKNDHQFLCLLAFRLVKDEEVAQDIVQEFFLDLWRRRDELTIQTSFRTYAGRAIHYRCWRWVRQQERIISRQEQFIAEFNKIVIDDVPPEYWSLKEESDKQAHILLERLPFQRKSIFLAYIEGLSYKQIAIKYQISLNTVKTQMKRANAHFKNSKYTKHPS